MTEDYIRRKIPFDLPVMIAKMDQDHNINILDVNYN